MKKTKKLSFSQWSLVYRNQIKSLLKDFNKETGSNMSFKHFAHYMYTETKHF